jgi:5,10-methylenetetrahydrofolate reductase
MDNAFTLQMQGKQLENEARRLQRESAKARNQARQYLKRGFPKQAKVHAQNSYRLEEQAKQLLKQAGAILGFAIDLRAAEVTAQTAAMMNTAVVSIEAAVNLTQLAANREEMARHMADLAEANKALCSTKGEPSLQAKTDELLDALEQENEAELLQLDPIPVGPPQWAVRP